MCDAILSAVTVESAVMPKGVYQRTEKHREIAAKGGAVPKKPVTCPNCGLTGAPAPMGYHIKNCTSSKESLSLDMVVAPQFAVSVTSHDDYRAGDDAGPCPNPLCGWTGKYGELLNRVAKQDVEGKFTYKLCPSCGFQLCLNCTKVKPKDKRSRFCSHSCQKLYQYRDKRQLDTLSKIQHEAAVRPEVRSRKSDAMKRVIESGYSPFMTEGEFVVRDFLISLEFKHNTYVSGEPLQRCFRMDFYHPALKVNVEIDGISHDDPKVKQFDARRDNFLAGVGIEVIRIPDRDISEDVIRNSLKGIVA
jgi:very-short-patch-repair endonuclease